MQKGFPVEGCLSCSCSCSSSSSALFHCWHCIWWIDECFSWRVAWNASADADLSIWKKPDNILSGTNSFPFLRRLWPTHCYRNICPHLRVKYHHGTYSHNPMAELLALHFQLKNDATKCASMLQAYNVTDGSELHWITVSSTRFG